MANRSFHAKGREGGGNHAPTRTWSESQVLPTRRADARALQNYRTAVRAGTRCAGRSSPYSGHEAWRAPRVSEDFVVGNWSRSSPQPNSTRPRIREPEATVSIPALRSRLSHPVLG